MNLNPTRFAIAAVGVLVATVVHAGIDVRVEHDKAFDFKSVRTWAWSESGRGAVYMARTQQDNAEAMREVAEPIIVAAMARESARRKLTEATVGDADVQLKYHLLMSMGQSAQTMGQFLPGAMQWGLPPMGAATQSLTLMNQGSLVFDFSANGTVVWRGVAYAQIKLDAEQKKRQELLEQAVRELLKRFPPKS
jgi:Domain of unknown function (DUF4136)